MKILPILPALFLLFANNAGAQADLRQDDHFFQQQKATYQNWLDHSGLGSTLRVQAVDVQCRCFQRGNPKAAERQLLTVPLARRLSQK